MAYTRVNYVKRAAHIIQVYLSIKEEDIPDTRIVKTHFPKHNIFISYRQWMNIKNYKTSAYNNPDQVSIF